CYSPPQDNRRCPSTLSSPPLRTALAVEPSRYRSQLPTASGGVPSTPAPGLPALGAGPRPNPQILPRYGRNRGRTKTTVLAGSQTILPSCRPTVCSSRG